MKQILFLTLILSLNAQAYNLQEILNSFETSKKVKALTLKRDSDLAENSLVDTYSSPVLGGSISYADDIFKDGMEYSVGISQDIDNPLSSSKRKDGVKNLNQAVTQEAKYEMHLMELELVSKYYGACSAKVILQSAKELYKEQTKRYEQVQTAYKLGEISKKELLFNKLDLAKLNQSLNLYRLKYLEDFSALQSNIDNLKIDEITCDDLILPSKEINAVDISQHNELKTLSFKKNAAQSFYEVHDSSLQSISYKVLYEKEVETKRYTVGLSIPIGGVTSKQEMLRSTKLKLASSYEFQRESMKNTLENSLDALVLKLEVLYDDLTLLEEEILPLNRELLELAKSAHLEGEGSVLEYLDASRSYSENLLNMLEVKKTYYYELFEFYKIADIEYGEI